MTITLPLVEVRAVCHDCKHRHTYRVPVTQLSQAMAEWTTKHAGHPIAFTTPRPVYQGRWSRWLHEFWNDCPIWSPDTFTLGEGYAHNADMKGAYVASADYTITLASLATSSTRLVGRESTKVDNTSTKYLDFLVAGKITSGTTPTVDRQADIRVYGSMKDTPTYPDVFTGADAAVTITNLGAANGLKWGSIVGPVTTTSNIAYPFAFPITALFGAFLPPNYHGLFVSHDMVAALHATGGNHVLSYTGLFGTVT